jgi:hypothetical protein
MVRNIPGIYYLFVTRMLQNAMLFNICKLLENYWKWLQQSERNYMRRIWIPQIIACIMLLWSLNPHNPYGYYVLLRWVCCAIFAYLAFQAFTSKQQSWVWILGITSGIFNPIIPLHLNRMIWSVIDVITFGIAFTSIFTIQLKYENDYNS